MDITKWDHRFLKLAEHISSWSKDPSTKVGAVITDDKEVVSLGYNGFPTEIFDFQERLENREIKYEYIIHAEMNALLFAKRSVFGFTLYTYPFMPCARCASMIIQAGIYRVVSYTSNNPLWIKSFETSKSMFEEARVIFELYPNTEVQ